MFDFFLPAHVKTLNEFHAILLKEHRYYHDFLPSRERERLDAALLEVEGTLSDPALPSMDAEKINALMAKHQTVAYLGKNHGWREFAELLLVVLIVVLGVRSYFIQPFKIPTHSMRPTLYGVVAEPRTQPAPWFGQQIFDAVVHGRTYHQITATASGSIDELYESKFGPLTITKISAAGRTYWTWAELATLLKGEPSLDIGRSVIAGEDILNISIQSGDHIFVNKMSYHFTQPSRGSVIVFSTHGIDGIRANQGRRGIATSQFYIKRCVALGGDTISIDPPYLYINGQILHGPAFERIYSKGTDAYGFPYKGYVNSGGLQGSLNRPTDSVTIPDNAVWAMGDNSTDSEDSRYWGPMPKENLVGSGLFVYWPFSARWGLIR